jgi:hypothetical protein
MFDRIRVPMFDRIERLLMSPPDGMTSEQRLRRRQPLNSARIVEAPKRFAAPQVDRPKPAIATRGASSEERVLLQARASVKPPLGTFSAQAASAVPRSSR